MFPRAERSCHFIVSSQKNLSTGLILLARACGEQLQTSFGMIGEFSVDLGINKKNGELVIFEINAKPMRFDEKDIEEKRLNSLADTFFHFSALTPEKIYLSAL